jgi:PPM family protein phosphatase
VPQILPRFDFRIDCAVRSAQGARPNQEDASLLAPELALFAIADGMGGHPAGEVASAIALEALREAIASRASQQTAEGYLVHPNLAWRRRMFRELCQAVIRANERVRAWGEANAECWGLGTTLDAVWLARDHAFVAHAGDSRVYLARPTAVLQLTQDHAHGEWLKAMGTVRPQRRSRTFDYLLNAVGLSDTITVDTLFVDLGRGDRLLLCTDGVHDPIGEEALLGELLRTGAAADAAQALVDRGISHGTDNATALVIEVGEPFVKRASDDRGLRAADLQHASSSVLLADLPLPSVLAALAASVEIELGMGETVPRVVANDLVAYIVLDGVVSCPGDRLVSTGALLFAESLVGVWQHGELPIVHQTARLLRVRADDLDEVCAGDPALGAELYRRIAVHMARVVARGEPAEPMPSVRVPQAGD